MSFFKRERTSEDTEDRGLAYTPLVQSPEDGTIFVQNSENTPEERIVPLTQSLEEGTVFVQNPDTTDRTLANTSISRSNDSFFREMNDTFSFADVTCVACLCLVPCFGIAGLYLGFELTMYLTTHLENLSTQGIMASSVLPPFGLMFIFMAFAFLIWGKSIDWAEAWQAGAQHREEGFLALCREFCSSSNPCLVQFKEKLHSLIRSSMPQEPQALEMTL